MLKLRAHHFLCMQGFQGYGYSFDFVENMSKILNMLKKDPNLEVTIIDNCDDVCSACTNNIDGRCKNYQEVDCMDRKVLLRLGLKSGETFNSDALFKRVNAKLKNKEAADDICGVCSWYDKCLWRLSIDKNEK